VIIGPDVKIFSENHVFDNLQKPIYKRELEDAFNRGEWKVNSDGIDFIADEFSRERILGNLLMKIQQIAK
jgi:hypothetical protein